MTETLINIKDNHGTQVVDARELYEKLGLDKSHIARWLDINIKNNQFAIEHEDWEGFAIEANGNQVENYWLSIDFAKRLCMMTRTENGERIRKYFIECEKVAKQSVNDNMPTIPQTYAQALLEAGRLALENEQLKASNDEQQAIIEQQKPKVLFANSVASSKNSMLVGELAKIITQNGYPIGQNRLFSWLRDNGYLAKYGERKNLPNQQYIEQGLFEIKKTTIDNPDGTIRTTSTTKVTGKGAIYFVNKFLNNQNNNYLKVGNDN